jgi:hypothetical protein
MDEIVWDEVQKALKFRDPEVAKVECAQWVRHCQGNEYGPLRIFLLGAERFMQMGETQEALAYSAEAIRLLSSLKGMGPNERRACIGLAGGLPPVSVDELIGHMRTIQQTAEASLRESISDPQVLEKTVDECRAKFTPKKSGCFVATAVYGTDQHDNIVVLSDFRDRFLLKHTLGQLFVKAYYRVSPSIARVVERSLVLRWAVRTVLIMPVAALARAVLANRATKDNAKEDKPM